MEYKTCECGCGSRVNSRFIVGHNTKTPATHPFERFWSKVDKRGATECWEWQGARHTKEHYGFMWAGPLYPERARWVKAHRISWEIHNGPIPDDPSGNVLHTCDNPPCVNPAHLYLGTKADNARDRDTRQRGADRKGELNGRNKLTEQEVKAIEASVKAGISQSKVAAMFKISNGQVSNIVNHKSWKYLWN